MGKSRAKKKPADSNVYRADGFVFAKDGFDAVLVDYLYNKVPDGKRRDQMKRLMILGLIQDLGLDASQGLFIPPRPIELLTPPIGNSLDSRFVGAIDDGKSSNNGSRRLSGGMKPVLTADDDRYSTATVGNNNAVDTMINEDKTVKDGIGIDKSKDGRDADITKRTVNGISVAALMQFKG